MDYQPNMTNEEFTIFLKEIGRGTRSSEELSTKLQEAGFPEAYTVSSTYASSGSMSMGMAMALNPGTGNVVSVGF